MKNKNETAMTVDETFYPLAIPFPSTVTEACPNENVRALANDITENSKAIANLQTNAGNVHPFVMPHVVEVDKGIYGIESLIVNILSENDSVFPANIGNTEFRQVAIATSMFAEDVIKSVQARFSAGTSRYPYTTVHQYLSVIMRKSGKVASIKLTKIEDAARPCCKPRIKYFLVQ